MADALLRHKLQPEAEGFIAGRLSKASEFCDVPEDWDVQPLKKKTIDMGDREAKGNAADDEEDGGDDGVEGGAGAVKRIEGTLDEDQIAGIWDTAYDWCNEQFQNVYQDEVKSEDEEDEDEMEDVVTGGGADSAGEKGKAVSKGLDSQAQPTVPNPNTVTLGAMLKFMSTGGA
ncbi:hypothetical protein EJ04DRAFT_511992 [Polyplosphaeria fusca]|uniref:Uncharacterized protein n=1 Tax=Polyplosphaeria fusca TaxID=682080 RepID=A0A9P4QZ68_9PLEO|nr:hypothetical protein EJ04DRAFT_511992 [Polyplosphaeria fusca]